MAFYNSEEDAMVQPCSLVICAPGEGQTDQYVHAFQDAIRMLITIWEPMHTTETTTMLKSHKCTAKVHLDSLKHKSSTMHQLQKCVVEPGCIIPAGGTFEFLLHHVLLQHGRCCSSSDDITVGVPVSQLLANALLSIPRQIYSHSPKLFLQTQTRVLSFIAHHSHPLSLEFKQEHNENPVQTEGHLEEDRVSWHCYNSGMPSKVFMSDVGLESVPCKYNLLLAVMQCVATLLRVDMMLHTNTVLHTQSPRLTNTTWNITEDEDED